MSRTPLCDKINVSFIFFCHPLFHSCLTALSVTRLVSLHTLLNIKWSSFWRYVLNRGLYLTSWWFRRNKFWFFCGYRCTYYLLAHCECNTDVNCWNINVFFLLYFLCKSCLSIAYKVGGTCRVWSISIALWPQFSLDSKNYCWFFLVLDFCLSKSGSFVTLFLSQCWFSLAKLGVRSGLGSLFFGLCIFLWSRK